MDIPRPISRQPLPAHAVPVFRGKIFDVYQWEQKLYDGTTATFEKLKRPDTVVVFPVLPNGQILLSRQEQPGKTPFVGAFGGRVEEGESPLVAVARELLEESGYEAERYELWRAEQPISKVEWAVYIFIAKGLRVATDGALDGGEKIEPFAVSFEEFLDVARDPHFSEREIVPEVIEAKYDPVAREVLRARFQP